MWVFWHANGQTAARGAYRLDKREGRWDFWHDLRYLLRSTVYVDGRKHGLETNWGDNGEKRHEGMFYQGLRDGVWMIYGRHGELLGTNSLHRGDGTWTNWHANGRIHEQGAVGNDRREGLWRRWRDDGLKLEEGEYKKGAKRRDTWRRYDRDGRALPQSASRPGNKLLDALARRANAHKSPHMFAKRGQNRLGLRPKTAARLGFSSSSLVTYGNRRTGNRELSLSYRLPANTSMVSSSDVLLRQDVLKCAAKLPRRGRKKAASRRGRAGADPSTLTTVRIESRNGTTVSASRVVKKPKTLGPAWTKCLLASMAKLRLQTARKPRKLTFDVVIGVR